MHLYVMRHGPAEDYAETGRDRDRALTPPGRDRVRDVARLLVHEKEVPSQLFTSPLVRAVQTAEIVALTIGLPAGAVHVRQELAPARATSTFLDELRKLGTSTMVVGHEPDLADLVADLRGIPMPVPMLKAMIVGLSVSSKGAKTSDPLRFILDPKTLTFDHDARPRL